ncbi:serine/threonine-protein kinase [Spirillospora sp. NPDC127200]
MTGVGGMDALRPDDPRRIGDYRLLGRLGAGGMGRVYLGRSARGRTVAVKLVHPELARDLEFRRRFRHEVAAARRVGGAWTAPVLDADTESPVPWVATGYVPGLDLQQVVERQGPLPAASVLVLAGGLARALRAVHEAGLIHRDLKPSNVLVAIDGPRVIDFGIARSVDASVATRTGALIGSPGFMSPEQVRGQPLTPAGDVFCLGAVLAFAATGRQPFGSPEGGPHALLFRVASEPADLAGLTGVLRDLAERCLAKEPQARPDLAEILDIVGEPGDQPWLPAAVAADLGRHTAALLDLEDPEQPPAPPHTFPTPPPAQQHAATAPPYGPPPGTVGPRDRAASAWRSRGLLYLGVGTAVTAVVALATGLAAAGGDDGNGGGEHSFLSGGDTAPSVRNTTNPTKDTVPAELVGTWEGTVRNDSGSAEWLQRVTVTQGRAGQNVAQMRMVDEDQLCEFTATLRSGGPSISLGTSLRRSLPAGYCGRGANQTMTANADGTVHWASMKLQGTLTRVKETGVPQRYLGRWWGETGTPGKTVRRDFDFAAGAVGEENVTLHVSDEKVACEAKGILVSAEKDIVVFSTRVVRQDRGRCTVHATHHLTPTDGGLAWRMPKKKLQAPVPLKRG